jgi:hypothetical protein
MSRRFVFLFAAGCTLASCSHGNVSYIRPPNIALTSWDGLGPIPERNKIKSTKARKKNGTVLSQDTSPDEESQLAALKPYSNEWWSVHDAIDRAAEARLAKKLIICRNCMPSNPDDQTASIGITYEGLSSPSSPSSHP